MKVLTLNLRFLTGVKICLDIKYNAVDDAGKKILRLVVKGMDVTL